MWLRRMMLAAALAAAAGCAAKPSLEVAVAQPPQCPFLEAKADFSCWWSDNTSPLSHCVLVRDHNPGCRIPERAIAYFNQGAVSNHGVDHERPNGTWLVISIFEDEQGRVGQLWMNESTQFLDVDRQAALVGTHTTPKPPVWPRWPRGYEGGPEQVRRR